VTGIVDESRRFLLVTKDIILICCYAGLVVAVGIALVGEMIVVSTGKATGIVRGTSTSKATSNVMGVIVTGGQQPTGW
jgi:hypothetical protein